MKDASLITNSPLLHKRIFQKRSTQKLIGYLFVKESIFSGLLNEIGDTLP